jgi:hypothetical protein
VNAVGGAWLVVIVACLGTMLIALAVWAGSRLGWWEWPVDSV